MRRQLYAALLMFVVLACLPGAASAATFNGPADGVVFANGESFQVTPLSDTSPQIADCRYRHTVVAPHISFTCLGIASYHANLTPGMYSLTVTLDDGTVTTRSFHIVRRLDTVVTGARPFGLVASATSALAFGSTPLTKQDVSHACTIDGNAVPCVADLATYFTGAGRLPDGAHTVVVSAQVNYRGLAYPSLKPVTITFTLDSTAPTTNVTLAPSAIVLGDVATVGFTGSDPGSATAVSFECSLDAGAWTACTSTKQYTGLALGAHTAAIRAKDSVGNVDATPATASWTTVADADGDNSLAPLADCNDTDARINPGADDVVGNGIDEDCSGADAQAAAAGPDAAAGAPSTFASSFRRATWRVSGGWRFQRLSAVATRLQVLGLPLGATVRVTCLSRMRTACPFATTTIRSTRNAADVLAKLQGRALPGGTVLTFSVSSRVMVNKTTTLTVRGGGRPPIVDSTCVEPGSTTTVPC